MQELKGTTIVAVRQNGSCAVAGDGQVTLGETTIMKHTAKKVRRIYGGKVVVGFAGSVADAFTLCDRFEPIRWWKPLPPGTSTTAAG